MLKTCFAGKAPYLSEQIHLLVGGHRVQVPLLTLSPVAENDKQTLVQDLCKSWSQTKAGTKA